MAGLHIKTGNDKTRVSVRVRVTLTVIVILTLNPSPNLSFVVPGFVVTRLLNQVP